MAEPKVIENTQRDLNIALVNELAIIFRKLGIDTLDVLGKRYEVELLALSSGACGGHCIGVDPYYLTHKAEQVSTTLKWCWRVGASTTVWVVG